MNIYPLAILITALFFFLKVMHYKFDKNEDKSIKPIIIESVLVFLCTLGADFLLSISAPSMKQIDTKVFVDNPNF